MWKKLLGLSLPSPLYADYVSTRKAYIQKLNKVSLFSSGPWMGLIVIDYSVPKNPTIGPTVSFVNLQKSMMLLGINWPQSNLSCSFESKPSLILYGRCTTRLKVLGYDERDIGSAFSSIKRCLLEKAIHRLTRRGRA